MEAKRLLLGYACVVMIFLGQLMLELFKLASWRPKSENYPSWLIIYHDSSFIMTPHLSWPIIYCIINNLSAPKQEIIMVFVCFCDIWLSLSLSLLSNPESLPVPGWSTVDPRWRGRRAEQQKPQLHSRRLWNHWCAPSTHIEPWSGRICSKIPFL